MNYGEINNLLSTLLADSSNNFFTASERQQAINVACNYLNSELRILRTVANILVSPTDTFVPLPTDFVSMGEGVDWFEGSSTQPTKLEHRAVMQLRDRNAAWENDTGSPTAYIMEGSALYLNPMPANTGYVRLSYIAMPNKLLTDSDIPFYGDVRVQAYHDAIAYHAAWQLLMKDRDLETAQTVYQYFRTRFVDLKENLRYTGDRPNMMVWRDYYGD